MRNNPKTKPINRLFSTRPMPKSSSSDYIKGNVLCAKEKVPSNSLEEKEQKLQENFSDYPISKYEYLDDKIFLIFNNNYKIPKSILTESKDFWLKKIADESLIWESIIITTSLHLGDIKRALSEKAYFTLCIFRGDYHYTVIAPPSSLITYVDSFLKGEFEEVTSIVPLSLVDSFSFAPTFIIEGKEHFVKNQLIQPYSTIQGNQQIIHYPHWCFPSPYIEPIYKNNPENVKLLFASCSDFTYKFRQFRAMSRKSKQQLDKDTFFNNLIPVSDFSREKIIWYTAWDRHIIPYVLKERHICGDLLEFFVEFAEDHKAKLGKTLNPLKEMCDLFDPDLYEVISETFAESDDYENACQSILEVITGIE